MRFIDFHCDTLMHLYLDKMSLRRNSGHIDLDKMKAGDALAQCFAIFVPWNESGKNYGITETPYEYFNHAYAVYEREMAANADMIRPARTVDAILENEKAGLMSAILTLEDAVHLDGKIERVDELADKGVRVASLTWNWENSLAYPNSRDPEAHKKPLKPFGLEAVARMEQKGIIPDCSHLSEGGFWDLIEHCKKPFIATHSCARALCDHPRNLTDAQLKAMGEKGGAIGVNFFDSFLKQDGGGYTKTAYIVEHARYIADKAGVDAVCMGSDFDGIDSTLEFTDYSGMPQIADALKACFSESEIDKICRGNALRVFRACW
jgi:membrane dipeptidase